MLSNLVEACLGTCGGDGQRPAHSAPQPLPIDRSQVAEAGVRADQRLRTKNFRPLPSGLRKRRFLESLVSIKFSGSLLCRTAAERCSQPTPEQQRIENRLVMPVAMKNVIRRLARKLPRLDSQCRCGLQSRDEAVKLMITV